MADSLYVCHFSNGFIKVGRSIDPESRIATHEDRVACMGILLVEKFVAECVGASVPAEASLIARCADECTKRHLEEWFEGLDYSDVVQWCSDAAAMRLEQPRPNSRWRAMMLDLRRAGWTQMRLAARLGLNQSSISALMNGAVEEPRYSVGETLIALHAEVCGPLTAHTAPANAEQVCPRTQVSSSSLPRAGLPEPPG